MNPTIEGALVGAGAAVAAQGLAFLVQARLKHEEFERVDSGVRRQVEALVDQVGLWVGISRQTDLPIDTNKMGEFLERLQSRIYLWEVSTALTNEQAEALYYAAGIIEVEHRFAVKNPDRAKFNGACGALARFWKAMGQRERSEYFFKFYVPLGDDDPIGKLW